MLEFFLGIALSALGFGWVQHRRGTGADGVPDVQNDSPTDPLPDPDPDPEPSLELLAAGFSTELAAIATAIECHGQLLIEASSPLPPGAANHRVHLVRDMRRLRWLSQKIHASVVPQSFGAESTTEVATVLHHIRRRMLELGLGPMRVEVEVEDDLPDAACNPTALRRALRAAIEVLLSQEPDPIGLFLRAGVTKKATPPAVRIETTLEVAERAGTEPAGEDAIRTAQAMELLSTRAADNLLAPYDVAFTFDRTPGVFGRATVEVPVAVETAKSGHASAPRAFTDSGPTVPLEIRTSTTNAPFLPRPAVRPSRKTRIQDPHFRSALEVPQDLAGIDPGAPSTENPPAAPDSALDPTGSVDLSEAPNELPAEPPAIDLAGEDIAPIDRAGAAFGIDIPTAGFSW